MAQRPASRGMGMGPPPPTGGMRGSGMPAALAPKPAGGGFGAVPLGMRPPTNAGGRPGSSMGVPQGMRPPTSGGMHGAAAGGQGGVALQTDVQVVVRPVTGMASGVSGMPTRSLGPGRVIADKSYYLTDLNKKSNDIAKELDSMRFEIDHTNADNALYAQLERRYESHMKEVRLLEGQLADFNLAFDKLRTHTNVNEIKEMYAHLRERNEREKNQVDDIFLKAQHQEKQTREIEDRIAGLHSAAAARIASLGEEKQVEYSELQEELAGVNERILEREGTLASLERDIAQYEDTMKSDAYRLLQAGQALTKETSALQRQKQELEDELNSALSPAEVKEKLTLKIKDASSEVAEMEQAIRRIESQVERLGEVARAKENDLADARKHSSKAKKYDAIFERDAKMSEFIAAFPQVKNGEIENKKKMKEVVVALLKHLSKEINSAAALSGGNGTSGANPDAEKYHEMKDEVSFKDKKLADSEKTLAMLQGDVAKRREELEKIESLDAKISAEIAQLNQRKESMSEEMRSFKTEDELRDQAAQAKRDLLVENSKLKKARDAIRIQKSLLQDKVVEKHNALFNDQPPKDESAKDAEARKAKREAMTGFQTKEKTLDIHSRTVFDLQEHIVIQRRESDFAPLLRECMETSREINELLIRRR